MPRKFRAAFVDRKAARVALRRILEWPCGKVLMAHGALVAGHLARGTLVAPLPQRVRLAQGLRLWSARALRAGQPVEQVARALLA